MWVGSASTGTSFAPGAFRFWRILLPIFTKEILKKIKYRISESLLMDNGITFLSNALRSTDTRDSITEILQYSSRLIAGVSSNHELAARRVYKSLSEGRKIFRLFRFIPELETLLTINESDVLLQRLSISQSTIAFVFYVLDNWIYLLEIVKRKSRRDIRSYKFIKNRVSLLRIILALILTGYELKLEKNKPACSKSENQHGDRQLWIRLFHESLRLWLTLHKLHLLHLFMISHHPKSATPEIVHDRTRYDILPGLVGLTSAITAFLRKTVLLRDSN